MAFDLSTAKPMGSPGGFDLSTAKPYGQAGGGEPLTEGESIASSVPARFLSGMSGPAQVLLKMVGPDSIKDQLAKVEAMRQRGMEKQGTGFDWAGLVGSLVPGGITAKVATKALPVAQNLGQRVATSMGIGAATAAGQPIQGDELSIDKAKQIAAGAVTGGVIPVAAQAGMAVKAAAEPFYDAGRQAIIGRTLNTAAGGQQPQAIQALSTAKELVPGSKPTVAQASQNAGLASLERAASATSPEATVASQMRAADQNAARSAALQKVAGTPQDMADAILARKQGTAPLIGQVNASTAEVNPARAASLIDKIIKGSPGRTQLTSTLENVKKSLYEAHPPEQRAKEAWTAVNAELNRTQHGLNDAEALSNMRAALYQVKTGKIGVDEALDQVKGLKGATPEAIAALDNAKAALKADDYKLRSNVSQLYQGARKNITDLLSAKAGDGSKVNEAISRELSVVMKSLDHQINKAEPAYGQYLNKYTDLSKPINQMEVGQAIQGKATNATGDVHLNALVNAMTDKAAQKATGFKRATLQGILKPDQLDTLNAVKDDLVRQVQARNMAGTAGSDTVRKLAYTNMIDRAGIPTFLREFAPTQMVGNFMARGADSVYGRANKEIADDLAQTLLDPQKAAQLMQKVGPSKYSAIIDAMTNQAAGAGGTTAGRAY